MRLLRYSQQWIDKTDIAEVVKALKSDWLTQGPAVDEFEKSVAKYCRAKYAVAFSSGTAALHGACAAANIDKGDEVIVPTYTFVASANCVIYCRATPVLVDVDPSTFCINPKEVLKKVNQKTKAIISVDFAGRAADYDELLKLAKKNKLVLIEDASQALGGLVNGKKIGSYADMTIFSLHPVKSITTGEGGIVTTNNKDYYDRLKKFRSHGIVKTQRDGPWYQEMQNLGYNYRLTDIQAALGVSQMKRLDKFIARRRNIANTYIEAFSKQNWFETPPPSPDSAWHLFVIKLNDPNIRKEVFEKMHKMGLLVQVHYLPVHLNPFYMVNFGYKKGDFPIAEEIYSREISIPIYPQMTISDLNKVITSVNSIFKNIYGKS